MFFIQFFLDALINQHFKCFHCSNTSHAKQSINRYYTQLNNIVKNYTIAIFSDDNAINMKTFMLDTLGRAVNKFCKPFLNVSCHPL